MTSSWNNASDTLALWKHIWVVVLNALEQTKPKNNKMHEKKGNQFGLGFDTSFFPAFALFRAKKKFVDFVRFASHFHLYIWYRCFAASYFDVYAYILAFEGEKGQSWRFRLISIQRFDVIKSLLKIKKEEEARAKAKKKSYKIIKQSTRVLWCDQLRQFWNVVCKQLAFSFKSALA